ncbi:hypothetical protein ACVIU7_005675 [Bradyrhizobium liaoningense]
MRRGAACFTNESVRFIWPVRHWTTGPTVPRARRTNRRESSTCLMGPRNLERSGSIVQTRLRSTRIDPISGKPGQSADGFLRDAKQSARYPVDKGALSCHRRAARSIYRWCERELRSRSTPQRSIKHVGSPIPGTNIDIRIPPGTRGTQPSSTGQRDAPWHPPHGAFAKSPADRCRRRGQQVADLAGTASTRLRFAA